MSISKLPVHQNRPRTALRLPTASLCLVSCVKWKLDRPAPAKDLYTSDLFVKTRRFVEIQDKPWLILSAKHGLVDPNKEIAPYEKTLNKMDKAARRAWAAAVLNALEPHLAGVRAVVFLAGERYREFVAPALSERGIEVQVPMQGMRIGEQLAWLNRMDA